MKKFFIGMTALALSLTLAGCGDNGGEATLNNLASQLDETSNIISSVQTVNPADINLTKNMLETIASNENSGAIYDNMIGTQQTLLNEQYYKTDILARTAKLKNNLSQNLKLSKAQSSAIKELTNNLEKYSNSVSYTQNDMSSTLRNISSLKRNVEKNSDKINAKLNRLACNSNARSSYYENIIFTLNQIEKYLNAPSEENQNSDKEQNQATPILQNAQTQFCPNCNLPMQQGKCENCEYENFQQKAQNNSDVTQASSEKENTSKEKTFANNPYAKFNSNNINRMNMAYPYGIYSNMPYGMNGTMPFGMYGNGYGTGFGAFGRYGTGIGTGMYGAYPYGMYGGYGMNNFGSPYMYDGMNSNGFNFATLNPNRNTDTYAPLVRNIDTYRAGTQVSTEPSTEEKEKPEQRLENFEKVNEDNTVEQLDKKTEKNEKAEKILLANATRKIEKDPPVVAH